MMMNKKTHPEKRLLPLPVNHLLVLDDDNITDFIVEGVIQYFSQIKKYKFESNGWKALEYLRESDQRNMFPELIIVDLKMPEMSGHEFIVRYEHLFHHKYPKTKVVVITNYLQKLHSELKNNTSVNLVINKPLNRDKFNFLYSNLFSDYHTD